MWRYLFLTWTVLATPLHAGEILRRQKMTYDGVERNYELYLPSSYEPAKHMPLWFHLHGLGGNGFETMHVSGLNEIAEREHVIVAYPTAIPNDWSDSPDHNTGFITALIGEISSRYGVDTNRVYSSGFSQGGIASYILGAARPDDFAAVASVAGTRYAHVENLRQDVKKFLADTPDSPPRPVPLLTIHGTSDTVVPYDGGDRSVGKYGTVSYPSVDDFVTRWSSANGCQPTPVATEIPPGPGSGTSSTSLSFRECDPFRSVDGVTQLANVQILRVENGRHRWHMSEDFDTNAEVWRFFSQHARPADELPGDFNADGSLDAEDLDFLTATILSDRDAIEFDLNGDGNVDYDDRSYWVNELSGTYFGDSNLDGRFDSHDFVHVFQRGQFEDDVVANSGWADGDWNGDAEFDIADIVSVFRYEGFGAGLRRSPVAVPEPTSLILLFVGVVASARRLTVTHAAGCSAAAQANAVSTRMRQVETYPTVNGTLRDRIS